MHFSDFLAEIQASPNYADQLVYLREEEAQAARFADPRAPLPLPVAALLRDRGIARLYTHQAAAIDAARAGHDFVVATGTASGKSLCYVAPLLEMLLEDPSTTALLLFPTRALCQDQYLRFGEALTAAGLKGVLAGVYDSDTPGPLRRRLRDGGGVIFTNPDMLHAGILPQHARWASFLSRLRLVVLDELHVYNGIFGSNMTNLLRRLLRLCRHYGAQPQFAGCSATIGNPSALALRLTGRDAVLIDDDGSPRGKRTWVFWNPPRLRETTWRSRRSANVEAHELMAQLLLHGARAITFSKAKMTAEMIYRYVYDALQGLAPQLAMQITPYRGGYLPGERREIERRLFSGELIGVSTTPALELGIDVGGLDASILVGYPGTIASYTQQAGRAGRSVEESLAILVGLDTPVNQYVMSHPDYLFDRPVEEAIIEPDNPFIVTGHLRCAAQELALTNAEAPLFGPHAGLVLRLLEENRKLRRIGDRWYHAAPETPQHEVSLRGDADPDVIIEDAASGATIGSMPLLDAMPILHPEAIYLHQGDSYRVLSLDCERRLARVAREEVDYYTQPIGGTDVHHIDHCLREKPFGTGEAFWGEVTAIFRTVGYERVRFYELDAISRHPLQLPPYLLDTMSCWTVPPESLMEEVRLAGLDAFSGLRGVGFATRMLLPLFLTCDTRDFSHSIGCVNAPWNAIFLYERYPNGLGFTETVFNRLHEILPAVLAAIEACPCDEGCPCCVGKPLRGTTVWNPERGESAIPSKAAALLILRGLIGDGSRLQAPDRAVLTETDEANRLRLERLLRRRLERQRDPTAPHEIDPVVPTAIPDAEAAEGLETADVAQRGVRRRSLDRDLRKRLAKKIETGKLPADAPLPPPPPGMAGGGGAVTPVDFPGRPVTLPEEKPHVAQQAPLPAGDSLAARARKLKKGP